MTVTEGRHPCRGAGDPLPAGNEGATERDDPGRRQPGYPVRRRGSRPRRDRRHPDRHRARQGRDRGAFRSLARARAPSRGRREDSITSRRSDGVGDLADVHYVRQKEPLGFGHAVLCARAHVGDEPFAVLVPDEIVPEPKDDEPDLLPKLISLSTTDWGPGVIAVAGGRPRRHLCLRCDRSRAGRGQRLPDQGHDREAAPADAPSDLASRGRYVFTPDAVRRASNEPQRGVGGEIQLTDAIRICC